jgi:hypothetical protein
VISSLVDEPFKLKPTRLSELLVLGIMKVAMDDDVVGLVNFS